MLLHDVDRQSQDSLMRASGEEPMLCVQVALPKKVITPERWLGFDSICWGHIIFKHYLLVPRAISSATLWVFVLGKIGRVPLSEVNEPAFV